MSDLNSVDIGILVLGFASILIGIYRGFLRETLTIVTWLIASIIAFMYGKNAAVLFTFVESEATRNILGISSVFVLVVLVGFLIKFTICKAFSVGGPSALDRVLGSVFGFARAAVIVIAVMLLSTEVVQQQTWYKESKLIPKFETAAQMVNKGAPKDWKENLQKEMDQLMPPKSATSTPATPGSAASGALPAPGTKAPPMLPADPVTPAEPVTHDANEFKDVPPASK